MTFAPRRHDLPAALVGADRPLSADVMGRSWEALAYLWQVTTNSGDRFGAPLPAPQGHTHDGKQDQTLTADAQILTGWPFGFGSPAVDGGSPFPPDPGALHSFPNGGWADGSAILTPVRSVFHVPYGPAGGGQSAAFNVVVLIEKGATLSAANAVSITATVGGVARTATSAAVAVGLEVITCGPWAAGALASGGPQGADVTITVPSGDFARVWHAVGVAA
jgi:hypothetical protein